MKKIIMILGICLCLNLHAEDLNTLYIGTWDLDEDDLNILIGGQIVSNFEGIIASESPYSITSIGSITSETTAIHAYKMYGDITLNLLSYISAYQVGIYAGRMSGDINNSGYLEGWGIEGFGINAASMTGNIYNLNSDFSRIYGGLTAIYADSMEGHIYNNGGIISNFNAAIDASFMSGNITNDYQGVMESENGVAISSFGMTGNIFNFGKIIGYNNLGIWADNMIGHIFNYNKISATGAAISAFQMEGNIENFGTIESDESGVFADEMSGNIYNEGTIRGLIGSYAGIESYKMVGNIENALSGIISGDRFGVMASHMIGSINNLGTISADNEAAIWAQYMKGTINNWGSISSSSPDGVGIDAENMIGLIINYDWISGVKGIYAYNMIGNIVNHDDATISGGNFGIDAENMKGDIINYGTIESIDRDAIKAFNMQGNIWNYGLIISANDIAIDARYMSGFIYNYGDIINSGEDFGYDAAIQLSTGLMPFEIYNYGLIESKNSGVSITAEVDLNITGNGKFIGDIVSDDDNILVLFNDVDGSLDLSQAHLIGWGGIALTKGEMIIGGISNEVGYTYVLHGAEAYVHLAVKSADVSYDLHGTMNPWSDSSPYGYVYLDEFYAWNDSTVEIDFGAEGQSDLIETPAEYVEATDIEIARFHTGTIDNGATISFIPREITEKGWSNTFHILTNIYVDEGVELKTPLLYDVVLYEEIYEPQPQPQGILGLPDPSRTFATISQTSNYSEHADYYNQGVAKYLDGRSIPSREKNILQLALQRVYTADELNDLLNPYNMVGYASLANNNISWINTRTSHLFDILGNSTGSETSASNSSIGSGYATANTKLNRDANGNNVWFNVYMNDTTLEGESGYELESDGYEASFGIDKQINDSMILGLALNISAFESDITGGLPVNVESDGFGLNAYGQFTQGKFTHKTIIGYTGYENEATRAGAEADFDSNEFYMAYRIEYTIENKNCYTIPFAGLRYSHITYDDIIEDGGNTGLEGYDYDSLQSEIGVTLVKQFNTCKLEVGASWLHELMDTESDATATSGIGSYSQDGIERDEDIFRLSIGLDYQLNEKINLSLDYAKEFGDNTDSDSINAKLSFSF